VPLVNLSWFWNWMFSRIFGTEASTRILGVLWSWSCTNLWAHFLRTQAYFRLSELWQIENSFFWSHKTGHGSGNGATFVALSTTVYIDYRMLPWRTQAEKKCRLSVNGVFVIWPNALLPNRKSTFSQITRARETVASSQRDDFGYWCTIKETPKRILTVTSSFNEISTDQLGNRTVVRRGGVTPPLSAAGFLKDI
jgi:hypothetical protein